MTNLDWAEWAEMSVEHRDIHDPDVVLVLHQAQEWAEIERLRHDGRLVEQ